LYGERSYIATSELSEPRTAAEASPSPEKEKWENAMKSEMKSHKQSDHIVELPIGRSSGGCKWVFKKKSDAEGIVERLKARLVAQGLHQRYGQNYDETCTVVWF